MQNLRPISGVEAPFSENYARVQNRAVKSQPKPSYCLLRSFKCCLDIAFKDAKIEAKLESAVLKVIKRGCYPEIF